MARCKRKKSFLKPHEFCLGRETTPSQHITASRWWMSWRTPENKGLPKSTKKKTAVIIHLKRYEKKKAWKPNNREDNWEERQKINNDKKMGILTRRHNMKSPTTELIEISRTKFCGEAWPPTLLVWNLMMMSPSPSTSNVCSLSIYFLLDNCDSNFCKAGTSRERKEEKLTKRTRNNWINRKDNNNNLIFRHICLYQTQWKRQSKQTKAR